MRYGKKWRALVLSLCVIAAGGGLNRFAGGAPAQAAKVHETTLVASGDTELYVEIEGPRENAPVILYLHGGPANPLGILAFKSYVGEGLEKDFIVAYLHQRGVLQSPDVPDSTQTIANHIQDVDSVVEYLRQAFERDRILLLGHSWGGTLAYLYLLDHEEKIEKIVAVAAPFNMAANSLNSYEMTLQWAQETKNERATNDLLALGNPPYNDYEKHLFKSLWVAESFGTMTRNISWNSFAEGSGYDENKDEWGEEQMRIVKAMYAELQAIDVEDDVKRLTTPLLLIGGKIDAEVPYFGLRRGFNKYGGEKTFVVFNESHHLLFVDEPVRFVEEVKTFFLD
jgi:pimeloyl-ACP methyl ester carboxylesterase